MKPFLYLTILSVLFMSCSMLEEITSPEEEPKPETQNPETEKIVNRKISNNSGYWVSVEREGGLELAFMAPGEEKLISMSEPEPGAKFRVEYLNLSYDSFGANQDQMIKSIKSDWLPLTKNGNLEIASAEPVFSGGIVVLTDSGESEFFQMDGGLLEGFTFGGMELSPLYIDINTIYACRLEDEELQLIESYPASMTYQKTSIKINAVHEVQVAARIGSIKDNFSINQEKRHVLNVFHRQEITVELYPSFPALQLAGKSLWSASVSDPKRILADGTDREITFAKNNFSTSDLGPYVIISEKRGKTPQVRINGALANPIDSQRDFLLAEETAVYKVDHNIPLNIAVGGESINVDALNKDSVVFLSSTKDGLVFTDAEEIQTLNQGTIVTFNQLPQSRAVVEGTVYEAQEFEHNFQVIGQQKIKAKIPMTNGLVNVIEKTVTVANALPTVRIVCQSSEPFYRNTSYLLNTEVDDENEDSVSYLWNLPDGAIQNTSSISFETSRLGTHTIILTVTDRHGASSNDSFTINVQEKPVKLELYNISSSDLNFFIDEIEETVARGEHSVIETMRNQTIYLPVSVGEERVLLADAIATNNDVIILIVDDDTDVMHQTFGRIKLGSITAAPYITVVPRGDNELEVMIQSRYRSLYPIELQAAFVNPWWSKHGYRGNYEYNDRLIFLHEDFVESETGFSLYETFSISRTHVGTQHHLWIETKGLFGERKIHHHSHNTRHVSGTFLLSYQEEEIYSHSVISLSNETLSGFEIVE